MTVLKCVDYDSGRALFLTGSKFVVVDTNKRDVVEVEEHEEALTASAWLKVGPNLEYPEVWKELAEAAVSKLDVVSEEQPIAERRFRIPASVRVEAQQAIDWLNMYQRGHSTLGVKYARKLLNETYLSASEVNRLHRYFNYANARSVIDGWEPGQESYPNDDRIRFAMRGGEAGRAWVDRIIGKHAILSSGEEVDGNAPHTYQEDTEIEASCLFCGRNETHELHNAVTAAGFVYETDCDYFGKGIDPDTTHVTELYKLDGDTWSMYDGTAWLNIDAPDETSVIIMLDPESAATLATFIENRDPENGEESLELSMINSHEAALFALAEPEEDWELVQRVFDIYDSTERSANAGKQVRDTGGRFGDNPGGDPEATEQAPAVTKARLPVALPLVPDIAARIQEFLGGAAPEEAAPEAAPTPQGDQPVQAAAYLNSLMREFADAPAPAPAAPAAPAAAAPAPAAEAQPAPAAAAGRPLYLAIVDKVDTEAVLDVVSLMPGPPPVMWKRDKGEWIQAPEILAALQGSTPPPVVEISDDAVVADVLKQVDASTTEGEGDEEATDPSAGQSPQDTGGAPVAPKPDANPDQHPIPASASSRRRTASAASSNPYPLYGPHGEIMKLALIAEGGADRNRGNAEKLRRYWTRGEGGLKIGWDTPGDMTRCMKFLAKYLRGREAGYCALRHKEMTGMWPGDKRNLDDK